MGNGGCSNAVGLGVEGLGVGLFVGRGGSGRNGLEFVDKRSEDGVGYRSGGGRVVVVDDEERALRLWFCSMVVAFC